MKKWLIIGGVALVVLWFVFSYNSLISLRENVDNSWAQVENQYQRRADLIPNLVNTVKGFADQEKEIFTEVTRLRSQWGEAKTRGDQIDAAKGLDSAISRLLLVAENYPQLKSNENFLGLQASLEGTENRVAVERQRYNEAVRTYNVRTKRIPTVFVARILGFGEQEYFQVEEGKESVPEVSFE
ncbi:MAG: LemA family protein [archaeon]